MSAYGEAIYGTSTYALSSSILVAAPRRPPRPVLTLYPPLGSTNDREPLQIPINPQVSGLSIYSRIPGGFGEMSVSLWPQRIRWTGASGSPHLSDDRRFQLFGHVTLTDGDQTFFEGRLIHPVIVAGYVRSARVMGYGFGGMRDNDFDSSSDTLTTSGNIIRQVLANAAPFIRTATGSDFQDPQVQHAPSEFAGLFPADILNQIGQEGNDDGDAVDWAVWEGQRLHLKPRVPPTQPHYSIGAGDRRVTNLEKDATNLRGMVRVAYRDPDPDTGGDKQTDWFTNPAFEREYRIQRRVTVPLGELTPTAANRMANAYLRLYSVPRVAATIETSHDDVLPGPQGQPVPAYLARAGEWWQIGDDKPLIALDVQQDWGTGRTRVQVGDEGEAFESVIAWLERDIEQRRAGLNPLGGRNR